ncbi:DUF2314 domain-containing protein [Mesobacterium sp. TK19101]|uniref:DUF2314 domain-containing protein n=1 Tax=Mesobacterium hydrothermale TaxID=3111907 RepID=A0ABU6HC76_9RHOB|nr:DUF2314 domain-containing protein [Mesobacterium sp. TK19101]MEC3860073.1 DUF2314 domain-containing protein [Mesobacterium sp. TK19101]
MALGLIIGRPLVWGGLAGAVLVLDSAGLLDTMMAQASLIGGTSQATSQEGMEQDVTVARDKAREYLPRYLAQAVRQPAQWETQAVLVELSANGATEQLWIEDFKPTEGEGFAGTLTNDAQMLPDLAAGARVEFSMGQIVDWAYVEKGVGFGYFTVHASLPYMPAAQAAVARNFLADRPLPSGW